HPPDHSQHHAFRGRLGLDTPWRHTCLVRGNRRGTRPLLAKGQSPGVGNGRVWDAAAGHEGKNPPESRKWQTRRTDCRNSTIDWPLVASRSGSEVAWRT